MDDWSLAERLSRMYSDYQRELSRAAEAISPRGEAAVLLTVYLNREPMLSGQLGERTGLTSGRIANILRNLEQKGQISRLRDREDKRRIFVSLTEEGRAQAEQACRTSLEACRSFMAYLGEDGQAFLQMLEKSLGYFRGNRDGFENE